MSTEIQLQEAKDAYHKLQTGQKVVSVMRDGKSLTYTQADRVALKNYIIELERALGHKPRRWGPARVML